MEWQESLKINLLSRYPVGSIKTILFTGCIQGDGVSTTAVNFATTLSKDAQKGVLLTNTNLAAPNSNHFSTLASPVKVGPGNLYVFPFSSEHADPIALFEPHGFNQSLKIMRQQFDYVIIDAPPVHGFAESLILASKVDGIILVIQSAKTRKKVAAVAKKKLEEAGGRLIGVVLNKTRRYIPEFIYKRF